jgi:hypothetical protein
MIRLTLNGLLLCFGFLTRWWINCAASFLAAAQQYISFPGTRATTPINRRQLDQRYALSTKTENQPSMEKFS